MSREDGRAKADPGMKGLPAEKPRGVLAAAGSCKAGIRLSPEPWGKRAPQQPGAVLGPQTLRGPRSAVLGHGGPGS